ncbi:hypothetical protein [Galbibacter sp. BG1]
MIEFNPCELKKALSKLYTSDITITPVILNSENEAFIKSEYIAYYGSFASAQSLVLVNGNKPFNYNGIHAVLFNGVYSGNFTSFQGYRIETKEKHYTKGELQPIPEIPSTGSGGVITKELTVYTQTESNWKYYNTEIPSYTYYSGNVEFDQVEGLWRINSGGRLTLDVDEDMDGLSYASLFLDLYSETDGVLVDAVCDIYCDGALINSHVFGAHKWSVTKEFFDRTLRGYISVDIKVNSGYLELRSYNFKRFTATYCKKVHNTTTGEIDYFKEDGSRIYREYMVGELLEGAPANHYYS